MANEAQTQEALKIGLKVASEYLIPGGSNIIKGDFKQAGLHAAMGFFAGAFFGLPGLVLVASNSLSKSHTGRHLLENLSSVMGDSTPACEEEKKAKETSNNATDTTETTNTKNERKPRK